MPLRKPYTAAAFTDRALVLYNARMSGIRERVAAEMRWQCGKDTDGPWESLSARSKARWIKRAGFVIQAMREPDQKMLDACKKAMSPGLRPTPAYVSNSRKHKIRWRAMIDEALK